METYFTTYGLAQRRETLARAEKASFVLRLPLVVLDYSHDLAKMYKDAREGKFKELKELARQRKVVACLLYCEVKTRRLFKAGERNFKQQVRTFITYKTTKTVKIWQTKAI